MTEFKDGDRVRVVAGGNFHLGRTGVVVLATVSNMGGTTVWVWLGEGNEPVRFYADELEFVEEWGAGFKVGDKVRVVADGPLEAHWGTVEDVSPPGTTVWVEFGLPTGTLGFFPHELELVEGEEPLTAEPILTPDPVEHPAHYYHPSGIEVIDIVKHESFMRGNIIKYVMRAPYKGNELEDLRKAAQYLAWEIERVGAQGE